MDRRPSPQSRSLPRADDIAITPRMLRLVAEIDAFRAAWRASAPLPEDRLLALRRIATIQSVGASTRIEGAVLSDREVEALLRGFDPAAIERRDDQEVAGYAEVVELVIAHWPDIAVTPNGIRQLHRVMMAYSAGDDWHRGNFKTVANNVAAIDRFGNPVGIILQTASPFETPQRMEDLTAWYAREAGAGDAAMHPLLRVGVFVVVFLQIHPFQDGNGRLSRLLTTLLLLQGGYSYTPYSSLERLVERRRDAYYRALRQTQGALGTDTPDWTPWLTFFLEILYEQTRDLAARLAGEHALAASPPEREAIVRHVRERGRVTMRDLVTLTGMNRNTLKGHLRALVSEGRLVLHGSGRGSWYALP
ncbi:MAG: Fic family protein [Thermomicrobiales bacterium]